MVGPEARYLFEFKRPKIKIIPVVESTRLTVQQVPPPTNRLPTINVVRQRLGHTVKLHAVLSGVATKRPPAKWCNASLLHIVLHSDFSQQRKAHFALAPVFPIAVSILTEPHV